MPKAARQRNAWINTTDTDGWRGGTPTGHAPGSSGDLEAVVQTELQLVFTQRRCGLTHNTQLHLQGFVQGVFLDRDMNAKDNICIVRFL